MALYSKKNKINKLLREGKMRFILLIIIVALLSACDRVIPPLPTLRYPFTVVNKTHIQWSNSTELTIKVNPTMLRDELYLTMLTALEEQHKSPEKVDSYYIKAYADNDLKLTTVIGTIYQSTNGGEITFKYKEEPKLYSDRYASKFKHKKEEEPVLSAEEKARQREVGKFAGELMKEADKIRNNSK